MEDTVSSGRRSCSLCAHRLYCMLDASDCVNDGYKHFMSDDEAVDRVI